MTVTEDKQYIDRIYTVLNVFTCFTFSVIKKECEREVVRGQTQPENKIMLLAVFSGQSGKCAGLQLHSLLEDHALPEQRLDLLSTTLNVLNKTTFEKFPRTLKDHSGRTQLPFSAYKPVCLHKSSFQPLATTRASTSCSKLLS